MSAQYMGRSCQLSPKEATLPQDQSLHLTVDVREPQVQTVTSSAKQPLLLLVWVQNKGRDTRLTGATQG